MNRILGAQDLQPTIPLVGNEELYAKVTGIPVKKLREASKQIKVRIV